MFLLNGKRVNINSDLTIGEGHDAITYPAASLKDPSLREQLGIVEVDDHQRPDDSLFFIYENEDGSYTTTPRPREGLDRQVWEKIKARRDAVKTGGVKVADKWFHTDDASRVQFLALNMLGSNFPSNLSWKTMDGSFVAMTKTLAGQVFQATMILDTQAFAAAEQHRQGVAQADNPFTYNFSTGWPTIYGEPDETTVQHI